MWYIVALAAACVADNADDAAAPTFDVNTNIAAWVDLWNSYDLGRVDELFLRDARVTYWSSEREGLLEGTAAIRAHHEGFSFVEGGRQPDQEL